MFSFWKKKPDATPSASERWIGAELDEQSLSAVVGGKKKKKKKKKKKAKKAKAAAAAAAA